ncbi:MAG: desulfoferrodoxin family protein [Patescibacteria group bacterium]
MEIQKMKDFMNPTELEQKHTPVIERVGTGGEVFVRVGLVPHPMEEGHHIMWIELYRNKALVERKNLEVGKRAEAVFEIPDLKPEDILVAREECNIHGLWESV